MDTSIQNEASQITQEQSVPQSVTIPVPRKKLILVIGIILGVILLAYIFIQIRNQQSASEVASLVAQAQQAYKKGDYTLAKSKAKDALNLQSNSREALLTLITTISGEGSRTGKGKEAFTQEKSYIDQVLKQYPNDPALISSIGYAYETAGEYSQALSYYDKAIELNPKDAEAYYHRGHTYEFLNQRDRGFRDYNMAYSLDPKDPMVLMGKAREAALIGNNDQATTFYSAITKSPAVTIPLKAEALTDLAILKQAQLLYPKETLDLAKQAVDTDPTYSPAVGVYGYNKAFMGEYAAGLQTLDRAIQLDPQNSNNYLLKGFTDMQIARYQAARDDFTEGLQHVDTDTTILGEAAKKSMKAELTYNLAKDYILANNLVLNVSQVIQLMQQAITYDPAYRRYAKADESNKIFVNADADPAFSAFIQSL